MIPRLPFKRSNSAFRGTQLFESKSFPDYHSPDSTRSQSGVRLLSPTCSSYWSPPAHLIKIFSNTRIDL